MERKHFQNHYVWILVSILYQQHFSKHITYMYFSWSQIFFWSSHNGGYSSESLYLEPSAMEGGPTIVTLLFTEYYSYSYYLQNSKSTIKDLPLDV